MVGLPGAGRTFPGRRRVRLGDCSPGGRLRLDAVARYVQDLSDDDTRDAGLAQMTWVVRRTVIEVPQFPVYLDPLEMVTWCSGLGSRWAERRDKNNRNPCGVDPSLPPAPPHPPARAQAH